jgi:rubrerythrin
MPNDDSNAKLFELAIGAEKTAMDLYLGLLKRFSFLPEVSGFWNEMLKDEIQHAQELKNIRDSLRPSQLSLPADPSLLQKARKVLEFSVSDRLNSITTLDDAYELAHEFERSEVNTVFAFLMNEFVSDEKKKKFALSELQVHLARLMDFSQIFGDAEQRRNTKVESS